MGVFDMNPLTSTPDDKGTRPPLARGLIQAVVLTAIMFASLGLYLFVLKWRGPAAVVTTWLPWDELVPFDPEWVWVYLLPYVIAPPLFCLLSPRTCRWFVSRGLVILAISLGFFMVLPTRTAARPPGPSPGAGLTALAYHNMIAVDEPPANAAPSLHVSLSCLLVLALVRDYPRWWPAALTGAVLVWLATLGTRQHHLVDVVTGILLTLLVVGGWAILFRAAKPAGTLTGE
jgi:PAP2 superfamily